MKLISPQEYSDLRSELFEFVVLCKKYDYRPKGSDFHEIIKFLLLQPDTAGGSRLCESFELNPNYLIGHMFESLREEINSIDENEQTLEFNDGFKKFKKLHELSFVGDSEYDNKKDFDSAVGMVNTGAMVAGAAALAGVVTGTMYMTYLFKKGKLKKMVQKELDAELAKLDQYKKLADMKKQLKELAEKHPEKPKPSTAVEFPTMATGPELEPVPEKPAN
jgi:hypothetical protein